MCSSTCVHYQLTAGVSIQVDKDEPYDYCTEDNEEPERNY